MISILIAIDDTSINFTKLEENSKFQRFYEELYYDSEFLQEFFNEPIWIVNKQFCFTLN